ncbi:hypothetical protein AB0K80_11680 [Streptomyces sp. NPDC052682]|uniref:hypothetical protein n=1 Tax=Streptomyces sp. NPDC052682 TaxID=3154954 RepID=UPI00341BED31
MSDELTVGIPLLLSAPMVVLIPPLVPSSQPRSPQRAYDADEATDCRSRQPRYPLIHGVIKPEGVERLLQT